MNVLIKILQLMIIIYKMEALGKFFLNSLQLPNPKVIKNYLILNNRKFEKNVYLS